MDNKSYFRYNKSIISNSNIEDDNKVDITTSFNYRSDCIQSSAYFLDNKNDEQITICFKVARQKTEMYISNFAYLYCHLYNKNNDIDTFRDRYFNVNTSTEND